MRRIRDKAVCYEVHAYIGSSSWKTSEWISMLEDQKDILRKILKIADEEKPQALLIAGDVYDKPTYGERSSF